MVDMMDVQSAFTLMLVEYFFDAVQLQLDEKEEQLQDHLRNATAFQELNKDTWGRHEQALADWTTQAFIWIVNIRRACAEFMRLSRQTLEEYPASLEINPESIVINGTKMSFEEMMGGISSLRLQIQKIQQAYDNMKAREILEASLSSSGTAPIDKVIQDGLNKERETCPDLEEGEIEQDSATIDAAQWEHFKELKEYMSTVEASRNVHVDYVRDLEQRITSCAPPLSRLEVTQEGMETVISKSMHGLRQETERLLVAVEDDLLTFKRNEYSQFCRVLELALDAHPPERLGNQEPFLRVSDIRW